MTFSATEARDKTGRWTHLAGALKESGGFTYSVRTGQEPSKGFAVSLPQHETKIKGHATPLQIAAYAKFHEKALQEKNAHLGGWFNTEDGTTYLDISHVLDSQAEAEKTAREHNQLAYFDLGTFEEHRVTKEKAMSLSFQTPTFKSGDYDLSVKDGKLAFWKQILPMRTIDYTAKDGTRQKITFDQEYLTDLATANAVDKLGFLLADGDNRHTMDPERWRAEVAEMEVRDDGLYGKIVFPNADAAKAVLDNPDLGVSARIRENVQRSDGTTLRRGLIHVLGTLDPQVSGMSPWEATDLSNEGEFLDLTQEEYGDMADDKTTDEATKFDGVTEDDVEKMTDEELNEFLTHLGLDPSVYTDLDEVGADESDEDEDDEDHEDEDQLVGAGADMSKTGTQGDIELANQRADAATARAEEALKRVAEAEWATERTAYLGKGVPPHALDLAAPVLSRADDMVIDLSVTNDADVNVSEVVRGLLDALEGTVDLSNEEGHNGHFRAGDGEDPDAELLAAWPE